jgi:D-alanyl-lipoteichoic acid acyltransferase DltB (MBOAT superfamily)
VNSLAFLLFFVPVLGLNAALSRWPRAQNTLLLAASWGYFALADAKALALVAALTAAFFALGRAIGAAGSDDRRAFRTTLLATALALAVLFWFKYLAFFAGVAGSLLGQVGWTRLEIFAPLGVSFFVFRLVSYAVDIYRGKLDPETDFTAFAAYVSFFPTALAGPIERPAPFLSQLRKARTWDHRLVADGARQILWGLAKKTLVADNLAAVVDQAWTDLHRLPGWTLLLVAPLYALQMYADFSGYSDLAIGASKMLGIRISPNFRYPFFASNMAEYWRGWHISLTSWLTDYVFLPLNVAFRDLGKLGVCLAAVANLVLVGVWHGANWTFAVFGLYHGLLLVPLVLTGAMQKRTAPPAPGLLGLPRPVHALRMLGVFCLSTLGLVVFRAESLSQAGSYLSRAATFAGGEATAVYDLLSKVELRIGGLFALLLLAVEWFRRDREYALVLDRGTPIWKAWPLYYGLVLLVVLYGASGAGFIYARF